jgi:type II secretory ATPase GspE/PulE/Tfp pilus assembly ATPase PilB-like protein
MSDTGYDGIDEETKPLGERLLEKGVLSEDQYRIAVQEQEQSQENIGRVLVSLGFVTEATIRDVLSETQGADTVDLRQTNVDPDALKMIPMEIAKRYNILPFALNGNELTIAVSNPNDLIIFEQVRAMLTEDVDLRLKVASESDISRSVDEYYGLELTIDGILHEIETGESDVAMSSLQADSATAGHPIVRLVNAFLSDAVKRAASDIHFEPEQSFLRVRYRIDGVLRQVRSLHRSYWDAMVVRLKVMSTMNIAESRIPQDGKISMTLYGHTVDFRVASQPTAHGENFVLRILDQQKSIVPITELGLNDESLRMVRLMMARPTGMLLVTGPTGSGKTTTLYSFLNHMNTESVNIMTLEDPIEYPMHMIRQSQVNESTKMDWAAGIRSMLRQDPDIILIGEIRDNETADMGLRAAMTGHQVLSTLHTNSALGVIPRLLDMGVLPDILSGNVIGVIAQRLIRRLCQNCKAQRQPEGDEIQILSHFVENPEEIGIHHPVGCNQCDYQGYRGRMAIMELLMFSEEIDELVSSRAAVRDIRDLAIEMGLFVGLVQSAIEKVLYGQSSLEEVGRVVDLSKYILQTAQSADQAKQG